MDWRRKFSTECGTRWCDMDVTTIAIGIGITIAIITVIVTMSTFGGGTKPRATAMHTPSPGSRAAIVPMATTAVDNVSATVNGRESPGCDACRVPGLIGIAAGRRVSTGRSGERWVSMGRVRQRSGMATARPPWKRALGGWWHVWEQDAEAGDRGATRRGTGVNLAVRSGRGNADQFPTLQEKMEDTAMQTTAILLAVCACLASTFVSAAHSARTSDAGRVRLISNAALNPHVSSVTESAFDSGIGRQLELAHRGHRSHGRHHRNPRRDWYRHQHQPPLHSPLPSLPVAYGMACNTQFFWCPLAGPLPLGFSCFCPSTMGPVFGLVLWQARNWRRGKRGIFGKCKAASLGNRLRWHEVTPGRQMPALSDVVGMFTRSRIQKPSNMGGVQ